MPRFNTEMHSRHISIGNFLEKDPIEEWNESIQTNQVKHEMDKINFDQNSQDESHQTVFVKKSHRVSKRQFLNPYQRNDSQDDLSIGNVNLDEVALP
jgi:hypothetical protein